MTVPREEPYLILGSIGIVPKNIQYYKVAFSHKSLAHKIAGKTINNERLEYLGDAVLDAIAADILYHKYPNRKEGFLTNTRAKMVQRETLNKVAVDMHLNKIVTIQNKTHAHNINIYGNAFEAMIGALFLDYGYDECRRFMVEEVLKKYLDIEKLVQEEQNFKSKLIEWCQKNRADLKFELLDASQDGEKNPTFKTMVMINEIPAGIGIGYTKRESQQKASEKSLGKLRAHKMMYLKSNVVEKRKDDDQQLQQEEENNNEQNSENNQNQ